MRDALAYFILWRVWVRLIDSRDYESASVISGLKLELSGRVGSDLQELVFALIDWSEKDGTSSHLGNLLSMEGGAQ